jgi:hypothetical protein
MAQGPGGVDDGDSSRHWSADAHPEQHGRIGLGSRLCKLDSLPVSGAFLGEPRLRVGDPRERVEEEQGLDGGCEQVGHRVSVCEVCDFVRENKAQVVRLAGERRGDQDGRPNPAGK